MSMTPGSDCFDICFDKRKTTKLIIKSLCYQQFKCEKMGVLRVRFTWFLRKLERGSICFFGGIFFKPYMYQK